MNTSNREQKQKNAQILRFLQRDTPFASIALQLDDGATIIMDDPCDFVVDAERLYVIVPPAKHVRPVPLSEIRRIGRRRTVPRSTPTPIKTNQT